MHGEIEPKIVCIDAMPSPSVCVCLVFGVRVNFRRAGDIVVVEYKK